MNYWRRLGNGQIETHFILIPEIMSKTDIKMYTKKRDCCKLRSRMHEAVYFVNVLITKPRNVIKLRVSKRDVKLSVRRSCVSIVPDEHIELVIVKVEESV